MDPVTLLLAVVLADHGETGRFAHQLTVWGWLASGLWWGSLLLWAGAHQWGRPWSAWWLVAPAAVALLVFATVGYSPTGA